MEENGIYLVLQKGYVFRNITQILKNENTDYNEKIHMVFKKDQVSLTVSRTNPFVLHEFIFKCNNLEEYIYDVYDDNGEMINYTTISFNTSSIINKTKTIGKKDSISFKWKQNTNSLYLSKKNPTNINQPSITSIIPCSINPEYERPIVNKKWYKSKPNIKIDPKIFSTLCHQAASCKNSNLVILYKPNVGIRFDGINSSNTLQFYEIHYFNKQITTGLEPLSTEWDLNIKDKDGRTIRVEDSSCIKFAIPNSTIKSLSKIHNIASSGSYLLFYFNRLRDLRKPDFNKFLKITTPMEGPCGDYNIYIGTDDIIEHY